MTTTMDFKCNKCNYHWRRTFSDEELQDEKNQIIITCPKCGS